MRRSLPVAFSLLIALPVIADETVDAVWKQQKVELGYVSLKTAYSCELMEARFRMLLWHVGAAEDITLKVSPCGAFDRPQRQHQIEVEFRTLVPADDGDVDVVKAEWEVVELGRKSPRSIDDRDCELMEAFQEHLLSTIEHEVIEGATGCNATRQSIVGRLKLRVLKPAEEENPDSP